MSEREPTKPGRVLIIAGSDPSGGAGIQADLKTVTALGGFGATAITALTVQDTEGVSAVHKVPHDILHGQIEAVLGDVGAECIKTGMLADLEAIETVTSTLDGADYSGPLVIDPVMVATSGAKLLEDSAIDAVRGQLLPRASLITPNLDEAEILLDHGITSGDDMIAAGLELIALGASAALVKGGHAAFSGDVMRDYLVTPLSVTMVEHDRITTRHTHGTGCSLASAVATGLAQSMTLEASVKRGLDFVHEAIKLAPGFGRGHGPLGHAAAGQVMLAREPEVGNV